MHGSQAYWSAPMGIFLDPLYSYRVLMPAGGLQRQPHACIGMPSKAIQETVLSRLGWEANFDYVRILSNLHQTWWGGVFGGAEFESDILEFVRQEGEGVEGMQNFPIFPFFSIWLIQMAKVKWLCFICLHYADIKLQCILAVFDGWLGEGPFHLSNSSPVRKSYSLCTCNSSFESAADSLHNGI